MNQKKRMKIALGISLVLSLVSTASEAGTLKLLTYNLWGAPFSAKKVRNRFPAIAKRLAKLDVDVVALEEVFDGCFVPHEAKIILKGSRFPFFAAGAGPHGFPKCVNSGVLLLSKFPIVGSAEMKYAACAGNDCFARKGVIYARVRVPAVGDVDVYATHTNAQENHSAVRVEQARQAVDFVRLHSGDGTRPVVFMGDLNGTPDSPEISLLRNELAFRDVHEEFVETHPVTEIERAGYTIDPARNPNVSQKPSQAKERIDYIFIRDARSAPAAIAITDSHLEFEAPGYRNRPLSDHFGVRGTLEIPAI